MTVIDRQSNQYFLISLADPFSVQTAKLQEAPVLPIMQALLTGTAAETVWTLIETGATVEIVRL